MGEGGKEKVEGQRKCCQRPPPSPPPPPPPHTHTHIFFLEQPLLRAKDVPADLAYALRLVFA